MSTFQQNDRYELWRVKNFFDMLNRECRKREVFERTAFDSIASDMLAIVLNACHEQQSPEISLSSYQLSERTHSTRIRVRTRLIEMARYGLVNLRSEWRNDGSNMRKPMKIAPNPWLLSLLAVGAKPAHKIQAAKHFAHIGITRLELEDDVQGFKIDTPIGDSEPEELRDKPEQTAEKLNELIAIDEKAKAKKLKEQEEWRKACDEFVKVSARIWSHSQSQRGHGSADPIWSGNPNVLAPAARKERLELTKVFQQWGGKIAATAWYVYTCTSPEIDENTLKRKFNLERPHIQFATVDKRPSTFAKYFNAILSDGGFISTTKQNWGEIEPQLRRLYGANLDRKAMDGKTEVEKIGYAFGDTSPTLKEVRA
jgi:hypothetical protein